MGKIRTRIIGNEDIEKKQKDEQKRRSDEKKVLKGESVKEKVEDNVKGEKIEKTEKSDKKVISKAKSEKSAKVVVKTHGKKLKAMQKLVDPKKTYTVSEAVKLLKKLSYTKFDGSVELHLNVDETGLKGEVELPHATGKTVRIKIVDDKVLENLEKGIMDFDMLITHPSYMPKLARFAKVLGPKGLMPNPKAGTISPKPEEVAAKFQKGALRFKTEPKFPLMHQMVGKLSFEDKALEENIEAFLKAVGAVHISKAFLKATMSPSVRLDLTKFV